MTPRELTREIESKLDELFDDVTAGRIDEVTYERERNALGNWAAGQYAQLARTD